VRAWTTAQNQRTRTALDAVPARGRFRARLAELTEAGTADAPSVRGDRLFTIDRWGDRDRAALVVRSITAAADGPGQVLLDPADAAGEVTSAIDWYQPSPDGELVAFVNLVVDDQRVASPRAHDQCSFRFRPSDRTAGRPVRSARSVLPRCARLCT
jgi:hypothetical protein